MAGGKPLCRVSGAGAVQASKQTNKQTNKQASKQTRKQTSKYTVMSKQKRIMAKEKVVDVKRETKSERKGFGRKSDHNVQVPDIAMLDLQTVDNRDVQKRKTSTQSTSHNLWKRCFLRVDFTSDFLIRWGRLFIGGEWQ